MIRFTTGNLLHAPAEALVNTVNEIGVMGKGIALMFKERFPISSQMYMDASKANQVSVGKVLVTPSGELFPKWIIHFPTKKHWRNPSKISWIDKGLDDLRQVIQSLGISSIAIPPLGCGNGGLDWDLVRTSIESALGDLEDVDVMVYEPTSKYQNKPKAAGVKKLTPARALIAELVRRYSVLGNDCTLLEIHKLAYFLQHCILAAGLDDPLDLRFSANKYGPYADRLRHLLNGLDGSYLHASKRISDASPFDLIWFESAKREYVESYLSSEARVYLNSLELTAYVIDGFESPFGLELLATVHWLTEHESISPNVAAIRSAMADWIGDRTAATRKLDLFDERLVSLALDRLVSLDSASGSFTG